MEFETDRLILRPWQQSDAKDLFEFAKDPLIGPAAGWPPHKSVEDSREIIKNILSEDEIYAAIFKKNKRAVGSVGLKVGSRSNFNIPDDEAELGYWIGIPYWGQGLIPEASRKIIKHGFEDLKLNIIWCGNYDGNIKSERVKEKLGFVYHHTNKDVYCPLLNETRTEHISILKKENWKEIFEKVR